VPLPDGFTTPVMSDETKKRMVLNARADPAAGSQWEEAATGRVFQVAQKPLDAVTLEPMVNLYYPGYGYFIMTVSDFMSEVTLPDGTSRPMFSERF
jgi:hypothetical protein